MLVRGKRNSVSSSFCDIRRRLVRCFVLVGRRSSRARASPCLFESALLGRASCGWRFFADALEDVGRRVSLKVSAVVGLFGIGVSSGEGGEGVDGVV